MTKKSSASTRHAKLPKGRANVAGMSSSQKAELAALAKLSDKAIDSRDIPGPTDWDDAEIGKFHRSARG